MKNTIKHCIGISLLIVLLSFQTAFSDNLNDKNNLKSTISAEEILDLVEKSFAGKGFSADFYQESPLPEIGITESAEGKAFFKKPEKFKWEYSKPDILHYISDGVNLWIHSLEDNNVWTGKTTAFFGKGSSASFLTDIKSVRSKFYVTLTEKSNDTEWTLFLTPKVKDSFGINKVFLSIDRKTSYITKIITFNINNEETRIFLSNFDFKNIPADAIFNFETPKNANIIPLG